MTKYLAVIVLLLCFSFRVLGQNISVYYYGTIVEVPADKSIGFSLKSVDEYEYNRAWKHFSNSRLRPILITCQKLKDSMGLNGWAIYKLVTKIGEQMMIQGLFGKNEAAVFETSLLVHMGYKARVAFLNGEHFFVACPSDERFASVSFMPYEGKRFYVFDNDLSRNMQGRIFPLPEKDSKKLENGKALDLTNSSLIKFEGENLPPRMFKSTIDSIINVSISVNKGMMDFYADMPQVIDLSFYAKQPLSPQVEKQLIPVLMKAVEGVDEADAANMLLQFMHSAFMYKTDEENFGYERTFYKEEMFFYPSNDCEDRSVLFAYLVEKLLGLNTIILEYPGHATTGVKFNTSIPGDYIVLDGNEYVFCDPSFVNSEVGQANPDFLNMESIIYKMNEMENGVREE